MKLFTIIFSLYLLALNFSPCSDMVTAGESDTVQIEVSQTTDSDHNHTSSDLCSPFCNCHCCHVHTIDSGIMAFELIQPAISNEVFSRFQNAGNEYFNSILQPPRA
ncbi:DUF6660 family protein [Cochleicola gelatinilyticus]|uniref:DUF6660 family protein n=1 Tax=Cochleicola gelatinilyticus TaxID=1763537 RepID=UPI0009EE7395|nr:DUF6660 family protein [Cochleicola gelatinilyticus]